MSRRYQKMQEILPEIEQMLGARKTHREVAEYFGLKGEQPIHDLLKRERRKQRDLVCWIPLRRKGRPRKTKIDTEETKDKEIKRLKMENELLRDFLHAAGRK
jgi:DNA-directed RNA polymerase specialized sigma subunit